MCRVFVLAGPLGQGVKLSLDFFPLTRLDGIEEFFNFGRNRSVGTTANRLRNFAAVSAKLDDFDGDNFLRRGRWAGA